MEGVSRDTGEDGASTNSLSCPETLRKERIRYFPTPPWLHLQLPVSFADPDLEKEYELNLCHRQVVVLKRLFQVTLVITAINFGVQYDGDLGGDERFVRYASYAGLPPVLLLTAKFGSALASRNATTFYEYVICIGFVCVAILILLANRSRSVWIVGGDKVDVFSVFSDRAKISMQSDVFTAMNLATLVIASFVCVPIRCARAWILLPVYPVVYTALTLPIPLDQIEMSMARRVGISQQLLIQSLVGFVGRVALEMSERDSILRMQLIQEMAVNKRVLTYKSEHEAEHGAMSQAKTLESHEDVADAAGAGKAAPEVVGQLQSDEPSAGSSGPWSCLLVEMSKKDHPELPTALLATGSEEGWLLYPHYLQHQTDNSELGQGHQGWVALASFMGAPVALKTARPRVDDSELSGLTNEIRALRKLRHPNIVTFYGVTMMNQEGSTTFALVLEYLGGPCLKDFVSEFHSYFHPYIQDTHSVLQGICSALRYMHGLGHCTIVHCDLKPQNIKVILGKECTQAKLLDFGYSQHVRGPKTYGRTIRWCAPELLDELPPTPAADVFSFGYIAYFCFSKKIPWDTVSSWDLSTRKKRVAPLKLQASEDMRAEARMQFLKQLCKLSPTERPSMEEVAALLSTLSSCESAVLKL